MREVVALRVESCNAEAISRGFQKFSIVTLFVTLGRRPSAMVVRQREPPDSSEGVRTIIKSTAGQPGVPLCLRGRATLILARSRNQRDEPTRLFASHNAARELAPICPHGVGCGGHHVAGESRIQCSEQLRAL